MPMSVTMYLPHLCGHWAHDGLVGVICLPFFILYSFSEGKGSFSTQYCATPTPFHSVFCHRSTWNLLRSPRLSSLFVYHSPPRPPDQQVKPFSMILLRSSCQHTSSSVQSEVSFFIRSPGLWEELFLIAIFQACGYVKLWSKLVWLMLRFTC